MIQIGDEDKTLTGVHTYVLTYTIGGAFVAGVDRIDLVWDAIGTFWEVPIERASVAVTSELPVTPVNCVQGSAGALQPCTENGSTYTAEGLAARQGMTVAYAFPAGSIADLGPMLRHDVTVGYAVTGSRVSVGAGALALLAGVGGVLVLWRRRGRDAAYVGQIPGLAPATGQESAVRTGGRAPETAVAFTPPAGVRPAELAMLLNQSSDQRGVTATLIDLAVRGYLRIEEIDDAGGSGERAKRRPKVDHLLTRLDPAPGTDPAGQAVLEYEQALLDGVFADGTSVLLSEQKHSFAGISAATRRAVENRAVDRGWFRRRPSSTMAGWYVLGAVVLVAGVVAAIVGAGVGWSSFGLALAVVGIVCLVAAHAMPARTADGTAVRAEGLGFRHYLETAEADQIRVEERQAVFSRYLPFAIAFDLADHWVSTFQAAMAATGDHGGTAGLATGWYVGSGGFGDFGSSIDSFSSGMSSAMTSASGSGGGAGGVGGGGGGGGGGSW